MVRGKIGGCGAVEKVPSVVFARSYSDEAI